MPRPSVGTVSQQFAASALAAHIAGRLAGVGASREARDAWLDTVLQVKLRSNGLDRAAARARGITRWLLVDESELGLDIDKAIAVFPGRGQRRPKLITELQQLGGARQIITTRSRRDVLCVLVFWRPDRDALFETLEAVGEPFVWDEVLEEDRAIEAAAWSHLAILAAEDEGLR